MADLVSSNIPNLAGGVSQQPAAIRRENQFEDQTNAYATLVDGLSPRRPTYHVVKMITDIVGPDAFLHFINRDPTEQYVVVVLPGGTIRVWDLQTGDEKTVNVTGAAGDYVDTLYPASDLKAITVADYTFLLNTMMEVANDGTSTPARTPEALVYVKQGNYGKTYTIYINGASAASYTTPDGGSAAHSLNIDTAYIAGQLVAGLTGSLPGWTIVQANATIYISHPTTDFTIQTQDGYSGLAMIPIKETTPRFTDLPLDCPTDFVVAISGDEGLDGDQYYLQFTAPSGSYHGVWKECTAKDVLKAIDPTTMPHTLIREADGTFTFSAATWGEREVGDLITNAWPSFVGRTISDVFFARNRLGLLSSENAIMSRVGSFFDFFRKTTTTLVDDDPIDTASTSQRVANMAWAVPFNKDVILFTDQGQYELGAQGLLTAKTAAILPTSEYESSRYVRPAGTGTSVFFAMEQDSYAQVREYWNDGQSASKVSAYNTTEHVPRYIPAGIFKLTASRSENVVAAVTYSDPTAIYVYSYLGDPTDRVQSAWTRWEMGGEVRGIEFMKADLFMVIERDGETWLETIPMASGKYEPSLDYLLYLDRKVSELDLTGSYDAGTGLTEVVLPYAADGVRVVTRAADDYTGDLLPGQDVEIDHTSGTSVFLVGDHTATPMLFGFVPETRITLSSIYMRESTAGPSGSKNTVTTGRLQLRYLTLLVSKTSYFRVEVKPLGRAMYTKTFNGRVVGSESTIIGTTPLYSGKVRIPILSKASTTTITIVHDSPLPMNILAMEWEGLFSLRSQRV
jgi:hypothetical protein